MADLYGCCESDDLQHESPDDAIEEYLDNCDPESWPTVIHVKAYNRSVISEAAKSRFAEITLEHLFECLCEDYGGEEWPDPTPEMGVAARAFVDAVVPQFHVWRCDRAPHEDEWVPVATWVLECAPTWIVDNEEVSRWVSAH